MAIPHPRTVQFEINIRARLPRGRKITNALAELIVRRWIDGESIPRGWRVSVVIWSQNRKNREVKELDKSERSEVLKETLRRALQEKRITLETIRSNRT